MNASKSVLLVSSLVLAIGTVSAAGDAEAATVTRAFAQNPVDVCRAALPVYEINLDYEWDRILNKNTSNAFITCSWSSQGDRGANGSNPTSVVIYFFNFGFVDRVTCTGVNGFNTGPDRKFVRTLTLTPYGQPVPMTFLPADFGGTDTFPSGLFSVSCNLQPQQGIADSYVYFEEDVGA